MWNKWEKWHENCSILDGCLFAKSGENEEKLELNLEQLKHVFEQQKFTNDTPYLS